MLKELIPNIEVMTIGELNALKQELQTLIDKMTKKRAVYSHNCVDSSKYHYSKYKHYAKRITAIDNSKDNGYAFIGDFLTCTEETTVPDGSYVIECCGFSLSLYQIFEDEDKLLLEGTTKYIVNFIKQVKEITGS